ncbi:hypothetical protein V8B55DRAFT_1506604 [Mucor lusitanicus]|uniref:C2H2-type domain-containing protein n=1 Tax=Mucor circinelloides f. lusitanicus TaxID=29924 RepID=A0A8H4BK35_MUCCL|nr:hypothetical protein FB192DRAFT_1368675 [Mucor lusitanicus]
MSHHHHQHQTYEKPSLPSIQFLLNTSTLDQPKRQHSRQSASISSLPSELQQLSLAAPATNAIPERSENHQPSWMMMPPTHATPAPTTQNYRRPPGASHTRSISLANSTLVLPPPPASAPAPLATTLHFPSSSSFPKSRHRRTVSANTTIQHDLFSSNLPFISEQQPQPQPQTTRAHTDSPPAKFKDSPQQKQLNVALNMSPTLFLNELGDRRLEEKTEEYENVLVARDEQTGRYYCPFCNKAFNRPSSLRIHTYSHTGEKPFVCQEEGCGRQFSVQSNMRRHLRVHRLGRSKK